ncbi:MAG: patatin family protein [Anaerovoracaceae bacterium]|jgi:predicted patatin/cPLA2 family phospholipase
MSDNTIIFEGGGLRGIFAAGVIDYLLDNDIRFDNVIGVSAGACHACSYVAGQRGRAYATSTDYLDDPRYCSIESLRKTGDMFGVDFLYHEIPEKLYPVDNEEFKKRGMHFEAVMTNCITGKAEYPVIKDLLKDMRYIRASSSLPVLARMVPIKGYVYMDGGIADSIPIRHSEEEGHEKNVIVLTQPRDYVKKKTSPLITSSVIRTKYRDYPMMLEDLKTRADRYNETLEYIRQREKEGKAFVIAPMGPLNIGRTEKNLNKLTLAYREGYYVAEGLGEKLKAFMEG